ncbi:hypothetical protein BKA70DRAFT_1468168 [Coprinopsis sp. MPI-PUGE-AT-0042]|nr:hypothetical protein BKA70DRAFT_1468168 [Coprinopsis sp. MPI-PUGE-AT-0042]
MMLRLRMPEIQRKPTNSHAFTRGLHDYGTKLSIELLKASNPLLCHEIAKVAFALTEPALDPFLETMSYFRYSDHTTVVVRDFLEVLVKQTIERHSNCLPIFNDVYERHIRERSQPSEAELLRLLHRFTVLRYRAGRTLMEATFYFLEALDEAPPGIQLDIIKKLSSLNAKLFVTCRPLPILDASLAGTHPFTIIAQDRDLDLHISKEISRSPVLQTIVNQGGSALRQKIASTLKQKCGGMFLDASLQLDAPWDSASVADVEQTLEEFPRRIEDVYQRTWNRILDEGPSRTPLAQTVLVWVLCAAKSLTIEELCRLVAICQKTHKFDPNRLVDAGTLIRLSRGLVHIEEETRLVRFVRGSRQEHWARHRLVRIHQLQLILESGTEDLQQQVTSAIKRQCGGMYISKMSNRLGGT